MKCKWDRKYAAFWTESSIYCYKRGCNCQGCYIKDMLESGCYMKQAVIELVKKFGAPPDNEEMLSVGQQAVIDAILKGANTKAEIAEMINRTTDYVQTILTNLYWLAESEGYEYKTLRKKLPEFIRWVRGEYEQI